MTLHTYPHVDQGSDQWHDLRRGIVTASTVGKLITPTLKVADNETPRGLTATLVAERIAGFTEETPMTSDMWRGVESEPFARDVYSGHYAEVTETGFMLREFPTTRCVGCQIQACEIEGNTATPCTCPAPFQLGYSPDGLVGDDGLIEIKAPRAKTHVLTILADQVPAHYMAQCQAGLLVSGRDWIDFVSYVGGLPLFVKRVYPDPAWFEAIRNACIAFEQNATRIVADYRNRVTDMPTTARIDFNIVELKLA